MTLALRALRTVVAAFLVLALADASFVATFLPDVRLAAGYSRTAFEARLRAIDPHATIAVLGDSTLWGYGVPASDAAVSLLRRRDERWMNLAFEGGSLANSFATLSAIERTGRLPRAVVFNVNLKTFNRHDSSYARLYPALADLAWQTLSTDDRARLPDAPPATPDAALDRWVASVWTMYGMRADLRDRLFGTTDAATALRDALHGVDGTTERERLAHLPTAERMLGAYDLHALDEANTSVYFLHRIVGALRRDRIPAYAILTPTNHTLLHDYIDAPEYESQLAYVRAILRGGGVRVLEYDRLLPGSLFLDNDHLTVDGNRRLADRLRRDVRV